MYSVKVTSKQFTLLSHAQWAFSELWNYRIKCSIGSQQAHGTKNKYYHNKMANIYSFIKYIFLNIYYLLSTCFDWVDEAINMILSRIMPEINYDDVDYGYAYQGMKIDKKKAKALNLTLKIEAAVKDVLAGAKISLAAKRHKLDFETLREEIQHFQNSGAKVYQYNGTGRMFSVKEELMLLKMLLTSVPESHCVCKTCTLKRLPSLAYYFARSEGKSYPSDWDTLEEAGKKWRRNFEREYKYEIAKSFSTECKNLKAE